MIFQGYLWDANSVTDYSRLLHPTGIVKFLHITRKMKRILIVILWEPPVDFPGEKISVSTEKFLPRLLNTRRTPPPDI